MAFGRKKRAAKRAASELEVAATTVPQSDVSAMFAWRQSGLNPVLEERDRKAVNSTTEQIQKLLSQQTESVSQMRLAMDSDLNLTDLLASKHSPDWIAESNSFATAANSDAVLALNPDGTPNYRHPLVLSLITAEILRYSPEDAGLASKVLERNLELLTEQEQHLLTALEELKVKHNRTFSPAKEAARKERVKQLNTMLGSVYNDIANTQQSQRGLELYTDHRLTLDGGRDVATIDHDPGVMALREQLGDVEQLGDDEKTGRPGLRRQHLTALQEYDRHLRLGAGLDVSSERTDRSRPPGDQAFFKGKKVRVKRRKTDSYRATDSEVTMTVNNMSEDTHRFPSSRGATHQSQSRSRSYGKSYGSRYGNEGVEWSDTEYGPPSRSRSSSMAPGPGTPPFDDEDEGYGAGPYGDYAVSPKSHRGPQAPSYLPESAIYDGDEGYGSDFAPRPPQSRRSPSTSTGYPDYGMRGPPGYGEVDDDVSMDIRQPPSSRMPDRSRQRSQPYPSYNHSNHHAPSSFRSMWGRPPASSGWRGAAPSSSHPEDFGDYDSISPASAWQTPSRTPYSSNASFKPFRSGPRSARSRFNGPRSHFPARSVESEDGNDGFPLGFAPSRGGSSQRRMSSRGGAGRWGRGML